MTQSCWLETWTPTSLEWHNGGLGHDCWGTWCVLTLFSLFTVVVSTLRWKRLVLTWGCIQELETWQDVRLDLDLSQLTCESPCVNWESTSRNLELTYRHDMCPKDLPKTQLVLIFGFSQSLQASAQVRKVQICTDWRRTCLSWLWLAPAGVGLFDVCGLFSLTVFVFVSLSLRTFLTLLLLNEHTPSRYRLVSLTMVHNKGPVIRVTDALPVMFVVSETLSEGPCSGLWRTVLVSHGGGGILGPGKGAV